MSQKDFTVIELDGFRYHCYMLPAKLATRVGLRISKALAPASEAFSMGESLLESKFDPIKAIPAVVASLEYDDFEWVIDQIAGKTLVYEGATSMGELAPMLDAHFKGRIKSMMGFLGEAIKAQYSDFLPSGA